MGTNYYVRWGGCEHCGKGGEELHVGKSSSGFHGYLEGDPRLPEWWDGSRLATKDEWGRFVATALRNGAVLGDEYGGDGFGPNEFLSRIGKSDRQAKYLREHHAPGSPDAMYGVWFWEITDLSKLPTWDGTTWGWDHQQERLFWVADGYTFSTGEWS